MQCSHEYEKTDVYVHSKPLSIPISVFKRIKQVLKNPGSSVPTLTFTPQSKNEYQALL